MALCDVDNLSLGVLRPRGWDQRADDQETIRAAKVARCVGARVLDHESEA